MEPQRKPIPALDDKGKLNHLISIDNLSQEVLIQILDQAQTFLNKDLTVKYSPKHQGKFLINAFFENSTRTRCSFEMAAKRLGLDVLNFNVAQSATHKGENLIDTFQNLEAMNCDAFVIRHQENGTPELLARHAKTFTKIINAGDGNHAHPSQALLDVFSIRQHKPSFESLTVAIVGDILHSRVARSQIAALKLLNTKEIRVVAPNSLLPDDIENYGVQVHTDLSTGLKDVDVIITLRIQLERIPDAIKLNLAEFHRNYGVNNHHLDLAKPDAIVMHPGPINRGIELNSSVADGPQSIILQQVTFGVAVRMAIIDLML